MPLLHPLKNCLYDIINIQCNYVCEFVNIILSSVLCALIRNNDDFNVHVCTKYFLIRAYLMQISKYESIVVDSVVFFSM